MRLILATRYLIALALSAALLGTLVGAQSATSSADAPFKRCRNVVIRNQDGALYTRTHGLFAGNTTCGVARRLARRYLSDDGIRPDRIMGFKCSGGVDGVACFKGRRHITWGYYFDRPLGDGL